MKKNKYKYKEITFVYEGKRYHVYGKTEREAKRKADNKRAELAGVPRRMSDVTVAEWADIWLNSYKTNTSDSWKKAVERIVDNIIVPKLGYIKISEVKPIDIADMMNTLTNYSASYANKILLVTKQIFKSAEENDLVVKDPARSAKLPKCRANSDRRPITPYERDLSVRTAKKRPADGLFFMIMLYCGCRPQEVAALKMSDFDLEERVLHITKARKSDGQIAEPKSKAGVRDVPVPDALIELLPEKEPNEYVCTNTYGEPLSREASERMWKRFKRAMELEHGTKLYRNKLVEPFLPDDLTPYCYRHTYCTDLQDAGVPIVVASRLMGHSDISLTSKIYTHHSKDSFDDALQKINEHSKIFTT